MARATRAKGTGPGGDAEDRGKEIELGPEADQRRNSGEREEEHQQHRGEQRIALVQAEERVEPVAAGGALDDADHAECADGGEAVGEDVVENRACALKFDHAKNARPKQDVAGVRDRGVGKQAAHADLRQRARLPTTMEAAESSIRISGHGMTMPSVQCGIGVPGEDNRDGTATAQVQHRGPPEDCMTDGNEQREAGHLRNRSDERRGRSGRAFIGVRRPQMEWNRRNLEAEARGNQDQRNIEQRSCAVGSTHIRARESRGRFVEPRQPVEIAEAEEQKRRRHAAEEVVLHRGFGALAGLLAKAVRM